ncbi:MAG TPA: type II toxin-antitoxin system VapC family toxin [Propylenella sp.]
MILVDTSVWIDHIRKNDPALVRLLEDGDALTHPFVIGELALGNLRAREVILGDLRSLPRARVAHDEEVLGFVELHRLFGQGIGYIDAHLLASVALTSGAALWTRDRRLTAITERLGLAARPRFER